MKKVLVYTMFRSLGDFILISNVASRAQKRLKDTEIVIFHSDSPYFKLLDKGYLNAHFFRTRYPADLIRLVSFLWKKKKEGYKVFGMQEAPGSLFGFFMLAYLKKMRCIDYIVDYNLLDADIVTFPGGSFIFQRHLLQLEDIFNFKFQPDDFNLQLPFKIKDSDREYVESILPSGKPIIALHPWSGKKGSQTCAWGADKCLELARLLNAKFPDARITALGIDSKKEALCERLSAVIGAGSFLDLPRLSIAQLAYLLGKITVFITSNSGPMHLAYIQKTKMAVLSGSSFDIWNPPVRQGTVIIKPKGDFFPPSDKKQKACGFPSASDIEVEDVFKAVCGLWVHPA